MDFHILGSLEVVDEGRLVTVSGTKQQALLALLLLHANETLSRDRLIDELWGEHPPATAAKTLQVHVSRLRRALANGNGSNAVLVTRDGGYQLKLDRDRLDAHRFERLVVEGRAELAARRPERAAATLERALALWRGPPLGDLAYEPFAEREAARLGELRIGAIEELIDAKLALGRHAEVIGEVDALIAEHPYRERLRAQKMLALYRSDRQAEALQVYQDTRVRLVEDLGIEPGERLRRLEQAILEQAHDAATRRLSASALRAEADRASLRATEADVADDVLELRALGDHADARRVVACPFKGLASFGIDDADIFHGRERLVAELVARLVGAPLLAIVGPSGSGKSSALRAGLLAALGAGVLPGSERWRLRLLRPGEHPLAALPSSEADDGTTIVAVDQFEEIFTACRDDEERAAFAERLVARAHDGRSVVIVAVRADFYGRCVAYPDLARLLAANQVLVGPMRRDELSSAIESPARQAGLAVDPGLVDALVADVEGEPGALPLLSTTLLELWRHRDGRRLRLSAYEHSGGVHGAVARLAESAYERLDDEQREIARRMLLRLAGDGEGDAVVRRRVDVGELLDDRDRAAAGVLAVLIESRLVTVGAGQVEVAHEALLREWPRLRGWLDEDVQGRRLHRHLSAAAHEWDAGGRDAGELYRGARLASVLDWAAAHDGELNAAERAFVEESRAAGERSHRRLRAVLAGVGALLVLAIVAGIVALGERGKARDEAVFADAQRLGARALVENDFDRALLLARQGVALDDRVETRGNLLATLLKSPAAIGIMRGSGEERFFNLALSPDGRTLAAGDEFGRLVLFDVRARRRLTTLEPARDQLIYSVAYSPDGRRLALAHQVPAELAEQPEEMVVVLDVPSGRVVRTFANLDGVVALMRFSDGGRTLDVDVVHTAPPEPAESHLTRFDVRSGRRLMAPVQISRFPALAWATSDSRRIVVSAKDGTTVRDATGRHVLQRFERGFGDDEFPTALSPDGRTLAAGSKDGLLRLMDLRTGAVRTASGRHNAPVGRGIVFTPDGRRVVTPGDDGTVIVWDVATASVVETFSGHGGAVRGLAITADGRTLYSAGADGSVFIWDLAGDRRLGRPFRAGLGIDGEFPRYALSPDGKLLALGQRDGKVNVLDAGTFRRLRSFPVTTTRGVPHEFGFARREVLGMRFLPGSHRLVVGGFEGFLAIVDADSGRVLRRLPGHRSGVYTPGISDDGRLMVTGSYDNTVRFWSLPEGRQVGAALRFPHAPIDTQLSPDGRWVVVVTQGSDRLQIVDARTREKLRTAKGRERLFYARFSPDGRRLAVGDLHGRTEVWSTATWTPITRAFAGHAGGAMLGAISPDNRTLVTGSNDGTLRLWDIETEQPIGAPLPGLPQRPVIPLFTPDGTGLIAAYDIGRAYRWDIRPASLSRHACRVAGRRLTRAEWQEFLPRRAYDPAC